MLPPPVRVPTATYRIQFTPGFGFEEARRLIPYLKELGISDLYASPLFQASSASTHGYDVNDYNVISDSLGGRKGFDQFSAGLRENGLGLLLDFVPNHMGIDGEYNFWWRHVLEHGAQSKYAPFFDIEWHPRLERLNDRVLVPMLGDHYGAVLEGGGLALSYEKGRFVIRHGSLQLPLRPRSYAAIFAKIDEQLPSGDARKMRLRELGEGFENLTTHDPQERDVKFDEFRATWSAMLKDDASLGKLLDRALVKLNGKPGDPDSFGPVHELLENQHYRLAHWKVGAHEVNYRRFFAVDTLIGLKMEDPGVFAATHWLLSELIAQGMITGIRLDHIDGLWNPVEYLQRLADLVQRERPDAAPIYTLVEKILAVGETLPEEWLVHGTSGYEFAASVAEVFLDRRDEPAWTKIYNDFTGETKSSRELTYEDKLLALEWIFPNAVINLGRELDALIEFDWRKRDISLHDLTTGLRHLLACLPVYRTYRMPGMPITETERGYVLQAVEEGIRRNPCTDPVPIRFLGSVIVGEFPPARAPDEAKEAIANWICKLQQTTGAVMAKSVEDTHFFRYVRLMGANEVGGHPSRFGAPVSEFHRANQQRLEQMPYSMLTTSTHDTKMSEDARARLFALAELPGQWEAHLQGWHVLNRSAQTKLEGKSAPDAREEYLLYQALLSAWPLQATKADEEFRARLKAYFRKVQGEARRNTTWTFPHKEWQDAGDGFVDAMLDSKDFIADFLPFSEKLAKRGAMLSLAQTVLRLTSPGMPDLYQGNEVWDFSLIDPDNRRPVDFNRRKHLLAKLGSRSPEDLWEHWQDGGIKMQVVRSLLNLRRENPDLFTKGEYIPLAPAGEKADDAVAFLRLFDSTELLVVVPRRLGKEENLTWNETFLSPPHTHPWKNVLTGARLKPEGDSIALDTIFSEWPVAVFVNA
jgi:(1->4)-alpha-D-glucan 1-alpha-D-glucosylmutase